MWKALRILKPYVSPHQIRIFSSNSCCYNQECSGDDCDIFGTLDLSQAENLSSIVKTAAKNYPINESLNKCVKASDPQTGCHKNNTESNLESSLHEYTIKSHLQHLHSFDETVDNKSSDVRDIVKDSNKKYLLVRHKKNKHEKNINIHEKNINKHEKNENATKYDVIESDGTITKCNSKETNFRMETFDQFTATVYHKKMLQHIYEDKPLEALNIFEKEMKEARVKPDIYCYNMAITIWAKMGNLNRAFELFYQYRKDGLRVSRRSVTSLFNVCAISALPVDERKLGAMKLRKLLEEENYILNSTNYNAMMKAFGRLGEIEITFGIIDEILSKGLNITTDNLNFLLQACISDKEAGFRHALMVWKRMRSLKLAPNIYSYNLFLRCIRDCNAGNADILKDLVDSDKGQVKSFNRTANVAITKLEDPSNVNSPMPILDLLAGSSISNTDIVGITELKYLHDRFSLLGGLENFLRNMKKDKVKPILNTYSLFMQLIPPTEADEELLLKCMEKLGFTPEITVINNLIRNRCIRENYKSAMEALTLLNKYECLPNEYTFYALSETCSTTQSVHMILKDMKDANIRFDRRLLNNILKRCVKRSLYLGMLAVLKEADNENILPSIGNVKSLENVRNNIRNKIISKEKENPGVKVKVPDDQRLFLIEYSKWIKRTKLNKEMYPWEKYNNEISEKKEAKLS